MGKRKLHKSKSVEAQPVVPLKGAAKPQQNAKRQRAQPVDKPAAAKGGTAPRPEQPQPQGPTAAISTDDDEPQTSGARCLLGA